MTDRRTELFQRLADIPPPGDLKEAWADSAALGIGPSDIPLLIDILSDDTLYKIINEASEEIPEYWVPLYCARVLGQLQAAEATVPLLGVLESLPEDDWYSSDLSKTMALIGPAALPGLSAYLADNSNNLYDRGCIAHSINAIGTTHPEAKEDCIHILLGQFSHAA